MFEALPKRADALAVGFCCMLLWILQMQRPLNADVAWLLDAGSRWFAGQEIYVDILELNPPLVFYDMALLTAGTWSKAGYLAGVCAAIYVSSLSCDRKWAAFAALSVPALLPFGQRDHLALIAVLPYLVSERRKWPVGIALFLGTGLKPHLLLIPFLCVLWRRRLDGAVLTLSALLAAYVAFIMIVHREFLTVMVPLARATYGDVSGSPSVDLWFVVAVVTAVALMHWRSPIAGAITGALLSYLLQGKFWYYHLVPAVGLAIYVGLTTRVFRAVSLACAASLMILSSTYFFRGNRNPVDPIPIGAKRVLFLTPHLPMAYPVVFERGVENTSPFAALWPVPGALDQPAMLRNIRQRQVDAIVEQCPEYIFTNIKDPLDYFQFVSGDPRVQGYRYVGRVHSFRVYRKPSCQ